MSTPIEDLKKRLRHDPWATIPGSPPTIQLAAIEQLERELAAEKARANALLADLTASERLRIAAIARAEKAEAEMAASHAARKNLIIWREQDRASAAAQLARKDEALALAIRDRDDAVRELTAEKQDHADDVESLEKARKWRREVSGLAAVLLSLGNELHKQVFYGTRRTITDSADRWAGYVDAHADLISVAKTYHSNAAAALATEVGK